MLCGGSSARSRSHDRLITKPPFVGSAAASLVRTGFSLLPLDILLALVQTATSRHTWIRANLHRPCMGCRAGAPGRLWQRSEEKPLTPVWLFVPAYLQLLLSAIFFVTVDMHCRSGFFFFPTFGMACRPGPFRLPPPFPSRYVLWRTSVRQICVAVCPP